MNFKNMRKIDSVVCFLPEKPYFFLPISNIIHYFSLLKEKREGVLISFYAVLTTEVYSAKTAGYASGNWFSVGF
jgi:hypothetical protein